MDVNSMAILILLGPGASSDYHLSADGKRYQLFQLNGSTFLYHNGMPDGFRWYF